MNEVKMTMGGTAEIFLSYKREDEARVLAMTRTSSCASVRS